MKKVKLTIEGMQCMSCASHVERNLLDIEGAKSVKISVLNKEGVIEYEGDLRDKDIKNAVKKAGYVAKDMRFE